MGSLAVCRTSTTSTRYQLSSDWPRSCSNQPWTRLFLTLSALFALASETKSTIFLKLAPPLKASRSLPRPHRTRSQASSLIAKTNQFPLRALTNGFLHRLSRLFALDANVWLSAARAKNYKPSLFSCCRMWCWIMEREHTRASRINKKRKSSDL